MNCKHSIQTLAAASFIDQKDNKVECEGEDNIGATIEETPEHKVDTNKVVIEDVKEDDKNDDAEAIEKEDNFEEDVFKLNREMSKHSFLSANSDSSEQRRKLIQNLKPNSLIFTEEETTYKPPRRIKPQKNQGKTGKFFFGKTLKAKTPEKEREPIKCVILDVGGERFIAQRNSLLKYPTTRLGKLMRSSTIQGRLQHSYFSKI